MRAALEAGAQQVVSTAKNLAPVDDGALRDSIGYTFGEFKGGGGVLAIKSGGGDPDLSVTIHAGGGKVYYAAMVEFGTSPHDNGGAFKGSKHPGTAPQPYFYTSWRSNKRSVKSRITRAMKKAIKEGL